MDRCMDGCMHEWMLTWVNGWRIVVREFRRSNPAKIKERHQRELTHHNKEVGGRAKDGYKLWGERRAIGEHHATGTAHPPVHPLILLPRLCSSSPTAPTTPVASNATERANTGEGTPAGCLMQGANQNALISWKAGAFF